MNFLFWRNVVQEIMSSSICSICEYRMSMNMSDNNIPVMQKICRYCIQCDGCFKHFNNHEYIYVSIKDGKELFYHICCHPFFINEDNLIPNDQNFWQL